MQTTAAFKAQVVSNFHNGRVEHTTYISAKNEADAKTKLDREGYEVIRVWQVQLTHLGGEISA